MFSLTQSKPALYIRSTLFNLIMVLSVVIYGTFVMLIMFLPYNVRYPIIRLWPRFMVWLARWVCGIRYQITGLKHLSDRNAIIFSKHQSAWETFAWMALFPPQCWVLKRELINIPFFGWALRSLKPIAIDRSAGNAAFEQVISQGRDRLQSGLWVVIFPEGTRIAPGQTARFKRGGASLAAATGYPVIPIAHNAGTFWPRRGYLKQPGTVQIHIGPAITSEGQSANDINQAAKAWIDETMQVIEK